MPPKRIKIHLRLLESVGQMQSNAPEDVIDYGKPNFFAPTSPTEGNDEDIVGNDSIGKAGRDGGARGASTGVAVGLVAFLYILMMICKTQSRREFSGSGQRSIHHRGNKRKIAPAPAQTTELRTQQPHHANDNNNGENEIADTNENNDDNAVVVDEEQPPVNEEEQHAGSHAVTVAEDNSGSSAMMAVALGALPTMPE